MDLQDPVQMMNKKPTLKVSKSSAIVFLYNDNLVLNTFISFQRNMD